MTQSTVNFQFVFGLLFVMSMVQDITCNNGDHNILIRDVSEAPPPYIVCDEALVQQAKPQVELAIQKAGYIYNPLEAFFKDSLMTCNNSTFIDPNLPHNEVRDFAISNTLFDVHLIFPETEVYPNCTHLQNEINSTIPYLECATNYIGIILQNLTSDVFAESNPHTNTVRETIYDAYYNISWIVDIKNLTDISPCRRSDNRSPSFILSNHTTCQITYDSITVIRRRTTYNECVKEMISNNGVVYQKQIMVLSQVTELIQRMKTKLEEYNDKCLTATTLEE